MTPTMQLLVMLGSAGAAALVGVMLGNSLRMKDHGWKLAVILSSLALGISMVSLRPVKRGIDLSGGTILIYEVDVEKTRESAIEKSGDELSEEETRIDQGDLIRALSKRIDPTGVSEIVIRPYGENQVEIIIPNVSDAEKERIKERIIRTGFLKFRILAHPSRNQFEWEAAQSALQSPDKEVRESRYVKSVDGETIIGEWVEVGREQKKDDSEFAPLKFSPEELAQTLRRELVPGAVEVFVLTDPVFSIEGKHLRNISPDIDRNGNPSIAFQMTGEGAILFGGLTGSNLPTSSGVRARLGIIRDGKLISAPGIKSTISSNGVIEGRFTQKEVTDLVGDLRAGKLPAVLKKDPISDNTISPLLGEDTIRKGKLAISASLIVVLLFMLVYYRFSGFVACLALVTNLILIVAMMIMLQAAFSLPGLAGLVLTVGMSVDANVLIFERIREELAKGATLRGAIRNGFGRATSTIVDANLTTLITAVVLYLVGTETVKGFAITLIFGILISMYTAIFCSRVFFDIAERKGWVKSLGMSQIVGETKFDFVGLSRMTAIASIALIVLGLGAVAMRGSDLLDIDFNGGTSVQVVLNEPMPIEKVRQALDDAKVHDSISVTQVQPDNQAVDTVYKIDTGIEIVKELQDKVAAAFMSDGGSLLKTHVVDFTTPVDLSATGSIRSQATQLVSRKSLDGVLLAYASPQETQDAEAADVDKAGDESKEVQSQEDGGLATDEKPATDGDVGESTIGGTDATPAVSTKMVFRSKSTLTFDERISKGNLVERLKEAAGRLGMTEPRVSLTAEGNASKDIGATTWNVELTTDVADTAKLLTDAKEAYSATPVWLSSSKIGSAVAGNLTNSAITAIVVSLLGIVGYIWVRFQHVGFGLAAVLALVHDVAITLGAVAISAYIADAAGFLMIEKFKISLPMVAAFLTIIGYSLNDTIVVFDRIREVKGKSPDVTAAIVNTSINQTLSRTLLTSLTTFLVVVILYMFGGQGIHGFAFALLIGVLVGTYSSIFVASPALLWLVNKKQVSQGSRAGVQKAKAAG